VEQILYFTSVFEKNWIWFRISLVQIDVTVMTLLVLPVKLPTKDILYLNF